MEEKELLEQEKIKDEAEKTDVVESEPAPAEPAPAESEPAAPSEGDTRTPESGSDEAAAEAQPEMSDTADDGVADEPESEQGTEPEPESEPEKMLTQSQVNELVGKARAEGRASALKELYARYGVNDDAEMNDIFGRGQGYDLLNEEFTAVNGRLKDVSAENALLKSGIVENRWNDVKAILGMKGLEVNFENIAAELPTHQEWKGVVQTGVEEGSKEITPEMAEAMAEQAKAKQGVGSIKKLGGNVPEPQIDTEDAKAMKYFGF